MTIRSTATRPGSLRVAAAQCTTRSGDLAVHVAFVSRAAQAGVEVLVFPELSLCGYQLDDLREWAPALAQASLHGLASLARAHGMTVVAGAPEATATGKVRIGSFVFPPDGEAWVYAKRHPQPGEEQHVGPSPMQPGTLRHGVDTSALAICAEIGRASHAQAAADAGASVDLASVLVSRAGYEVDAAHLQRRAVRQGLGVLMANHGGPPESTARNRWRISARTASSCPTSRWPPSSKPMKRAPGMRLAVYRAAA